MREMNWSATQRKANRRKLAAALRSGDYTQGEGVLVKVYRNPEDGEQWYEHCCLGVACEVMHSHHHLPHPTELELDDAQIEHAHLIYSGEETYLPSSAMRYFGFKTHAGNFDRRALPPKRPNGKPWTFTSDSSLVSMNDDHIPFDEIADVIELEPAGLCFATYDELELASPAASS